MIHYLKKQWRLSTLTCLFAIIAYGAQALIQLALMKIFDAVVLLDLRSTIFWTAVDLTCWGGYFLFTALQEHCQAKTIRALNNTVRDGLYHSFLRKSHTDFHQSDTGEYLARLTNDIKQLEQLAWIPFFGCVGRIAQIVFSILGLAFLHWSLVVFFRDHSSCPLALPKTVPEEVGTTGAKLRCAADCRHQPFEGPSDRL